MHQFISLSHKTINPFHLFSAGGLTRFAHLFPVETGTFSFIWLLDIQRFTVVA
ncbi:hypothetical protein ALQ63_02307 [Serratia plymuthica]|nr:hypothetical protein ALQ63_02307 [Serratia plymuthica]